MKKEMTMKEKRFSFFAYPQKRKVESQPTFGTLPFARHKNQRFAKVKESNLATAKNNCNQVNINHLNIMFMNMKIMSTFFSLVMLMNINNALSQDLNMINQNVINVVENSMKPFLDSIPNEILINYGIKDKGEINKATIGNPIAVYTIAKDSLIFTDTWRVPLIIDNEYKSLFTVFKNVDEEYKIVDFGAILLAQEIFKKSKDNDFKGLLRVYEIRKDFFICDNNEGVFEFQPIPNPEKKKYTLTVILNLTK